MSDNFKVGDYIIDDLTPFSSGAFGKAYHCRKKGYGKAQDYVAKKIHYNSDTKDVIDGEIEISKEIECIDCDFVLKYEQCAQIGDSVFFITKYCNQGTLDAYVSKLIFLSLKEIKNIFRNVAEALKAIHSKGIIHRDIKPANVFLNKDKKRLAGILADFGFSKKKSVTSTILGTQITMSPELLNLKHSNNSVDIWAYGITLYNSCFGLFPFIDKIKDKVEAKVYKIPRYFMISRECMELIEQCLQYDPNKRITAKDIIQHEFFKKDFKELELYFTQEELELRLDDKVFKNNYIKWTSCGKLELIYKKS